MTILELMERKGACRERRLSLLRRRPRDRTSPAIEQFFGHIQACQTARDFLDGVGTFEDLFDVASDSNLEYLRSFVEGYEGSSIAKCNCRRPGDSLCTDGVCMSCAREHRERCRFRQFNEWWHDASDDEQLTLAMFFFLYKRWVA